MRWLGLGAGRLCICGICCACCICCIWPRGVFHLLCPDGHREKRNPNGQQSRTHESPLCRKTQHAPCHAVGAVQRSRWPCMNATRGASQVLPFHAWTSGRRQAGRDVARELCVVLLPDLHDRVPAVDLHTLGSSSRCRLRSRCSRLPRSRSARDDLLGYAGARDPMTCLRSPAPVPKPVDSRALFVTAPGVRQAPAYCCVQG